MNKINEYIEAMFGRKKYFVQMFEHLKDSATFILCLNI